MVVIKKKSMRMSRHTSSSTYYVFREEGRRAKVIIIYMFSGMSLFQYKNINQAISIEANQFGFSDNWCCLHFGLLIFYKISKAKWVIQNDTI